MNWLSILTFIKLHWEWFTGIIVSIIGACISLKAYKYSKQANEDTNTLIRNALDKAVKENDKENIRNSLIESGISEWRLKGQAKIFLLNEYNRLKDRGWTKRQFEEIYKTIGMLFKGKEPKQPLFDA